MNGVVRLLYDSGYRNPQYESVGEDDQTDLGYVCGYCTNDTEGYFLRATTAPPYVINEDNTTWWLWEDDDSNETATVAENVTSVICELSEKIDTVLFQRCILFPGALILLALSFLLRRRRFHLDCCSGRPGLVFPVNLVDHQKNRFSYVAAFTLSGWNMLFMIIENEMPFYKVEVAHSTDIFTDPPWLVKPSVKAFYVAVGCIQFAFIYYPIFAALSSHHLIGYVAGMLYTWLLAVVFCMDDYLCPKDKSPDEVTLNYVSVAPPLICLLYLAIVFPVRVIQHLCRTTVGAEAPFPDTLALDETQYVKDLFHRNKLPPPAQVPLRQRILNKLYVPTPGFKYSVSVLTGAALGICFCFMAFIVFLQGFHMIWKHVEPRLKKALSAAQSGTQLGSTDPEVIVWQVIYWYLTPANQTCTPWLKRAVYWVDTFKGCYIAAAVLAFINITICVLLAVKNYKANMLMIYQGRQRDIHRAEDYTPKTLLLAAAKYVGFQAAYATWGYIIQSALLFIAFLVISAFFNLLCPDTIRIIITKIIQYFWVTIAVVVAVFLAQFLMGRYLFTLKNEKGEHVLALDNRRLFFNFNYFTIFSNTALGVVTCIVRMLKSFILGLYILPRLDMSILNRHYEWLDTSFMSFVGLLYLENAHRNPVMLVALGCFIERRMKNHNSNGEMFVVNGHKKPKLSRHHSLAYMRARNRWLLGWTLYNNPGLRLYRKKTIAALFYRVEPPPQYSAQIKRVLYDRSSLGKGAPPPVIW